MTKDYVKVSPYHDKCVYIYFVVDVVINLIFNTCSILPEAADVKD